MSTTKSYYANLKTKSITHEKDGTTLNAYAYQYDKNGNRTQQVETQNSTTETTTYSFDATDRLTQAAYPNQTVAYSYDKNYNRTREVITGENPETKNFIYNSRNQLTQIINSDNSKNVSYQFDDNGNQTQKTKNGVITTFVYNTQNQLVSVQEDLTTLGQFYYNYAGLRTQKTANGTTSNYSYDGDSVLTQSDTSNATTVKYDYGAEQLLSLKPQSTARQYYHNDVLGSTTLLTNTLGVQQASYQYDAWGNSRGETGSSDNVFGFTGHEKDTETGLYYFKARYYDPDTARFLNQDSYLGDVDTPPSLHRYLYAYGNPTVWVDLDGHEAREISDEAKEKLEYIRQLKESWKLTPEEQKKKDEIEFDRFQKDAQAKAQRAEIKENEASAGIKKVQQYTPAQLYYKKIFTAGNAEAESYGDLIGDLYPPTAIAGAILNKKAVSGKQYGSLERGITFATIGIGGALKVVGKRIKSLDSTQQLTSFKSKSSLLDSDTVAFVSVNGKSVFGVNSGAQKRIADSLGKENVGLELRKKFLESIQYTGGLTGRKLNPGAQALLHAESHSLMRASIKFGDDLPKNLTMHVDRRTCNQCSGVAGLPQMIKLLKLDSLVVHSPTRSIEFIRNGDKVIKRELK